MVRCCTSALRYADMFYQVLDVLWRRRGYAGYQEGYTEVHDGANCTEGIG